jgi:hypothetical protein
VLSKTKTIALTLIAGMALLVAQDKPAAPQKVAKDQAEADLINGMAKEPDPAKRLATLDKWSKDYPETAFADERQQAYLQTYAQMQDCKNASKMAREVLSKNPSHDLSLRIIIGCIYAMKSPDATEMDSAEKAGSYIVEHPTKAADNNMSPQDWDTFVNVNARNVPAFLDFTVRKDDAKSEGDMKKILQADPTDALVSYWLATVLFGQREKKPENQPPAIFEYARAGLYDGPHATDATTKKAALARAQSYYKAYHGSDEGWDKLAALAKANSLPPDGFTIKSKNELDVEAAEAQAKIDAADPINALWRKIKEGLTSGSEAAFWEQLKDSGIPSADGSQKFKGKLVSQTAKTLVIDYRDPKGDITLTFAMPLRGKMEPGAELEFWGTVKAYQKDPYMLTLEIADPKTDLVGWKPVAAPPPAVKKGGPAGVKKKAQ